MSSERAPKRRRLEPLAGQSASLPGFATWNIEQDYENRPRKKDKKKDKRDRLLVKSQESGRWEQDVSHADVESEDEADNSPVESDGEVDSAVADLQSKPTPKKSTVSPKEEIRLAKEDLARAAGLLNENPEEHIGSLNTLAELANSSNITVRKLALGTQYAVYKDIIPGYRIRPSKDDPQAKLSKEVKKLRSFEQTLLGGYRDYVNLLSRLAAGKGSGDTSLISIAISCACNLLTSVPHFNYRNDLIGILVQKLSSRGIDAYSVNCASALEQLFREDEDSNASLEAVSQLTKMMKAKNYNIHERVLNILLDLRLLSEFAHKASTNRIDKEDDGTNKATKKAKQKKEFRTKRERKLLRERKEVAKEMKEADAAVSYEERDKNQAETLKLVFVAYFRILKERTSHLMGAVLEGLAKYAHLINQDFFGDVLESLKDLIKDASKSLEENVEGEEDVTSHDSPRDSTRESLLCIITAFALLQGQQDVAKSAKALHLDLNFFTTHLYQTLLPLSVEADIEGDSKRFNEYSNDVDTSTSRSKVNVATTTVLLLRSLQAILLPPTSTKSVPPIRVAAFLKQLLTLALHLPQKSSIAVLSLLQQVVKTHGNKIASLWNTEERKGDGVFDPLSEGVESSNVFASTVWEGELLRCHFDPKIREAVVGIEKAVGEVK